MKTIHNYGFVILLSIIFAVIAVGLSSTPMPSEQPQGVVLTLSLEKKEIQLGDPVKFALNFSNDGEEPIRVPSGGVASGNLRVLVSSTDQEYRVYNTSGWGRFPERVVTLNSGQSVDVADSKAAILWNAVPDYSNLNMDAAKTADRMEKRILTNYAFPEAGIYFIKVTSCLIDEIKGCAIPIESNIVQINVVEPFGGDFEAWKILKQNHQLGFFLQHARFPDGIEKSSVIAKTNFVIESYPHGSISSRLKENLKQFHIDDKQRVIYIDRLKRKP